MSGFTIEQDSALVVVTLDQPEVGNALSRDTATGLVDVFDDISLARDDVRAVLIRAAGKHFCTGADIRGSGERAAERPINGHMVRGLAKSHHRLIETVFNCRVPVVAAVQGAAFGAGLHLALAADFVIASERARFSEPFIDRGFNVDSGGSWLLPRFIGLTRAKRLLYLGEPLDAATALAWGLITDVVSPEDLDDAARQLGHRLASRPTQALAATKRLLHDNAMSGLEQALHAESMAVELTIRSNDFKEGMAAFAQKRPPEFTGT